MSYVTVFFAWLGMQNSNLTGSAWNYEFWSKCSLEYLCLPTFRGGSGASFLVVALVRWNNQLVRVIACAASLGCVGCVGLIFLLLPLGAWINMREAAGIVASMSATEGIVNMSNFIISVLLFFLFGSIF